MADVRGAAVAGHFYPGSPPALRAEVQAHLGGAAVPGRCAVPKAIIVPHAGYVYSGAIAGAAYARLHGGRTTIRRVVLFGPAHRVAIRGLALPSARAFATPLGEVELDSACIRAALALPQVSLDDSAHAFEHSLEVQLPFLQRTIDDFRIIPFAVGSATPGEVDEVVELLWGGAETLFVISSDLSHYRRYADAQAIDRATADAILALSPRLDHEEACGATPINGLLVAARRHGLRPELIDLRNSGDTAGDKSRVVGYAAFAFSGDAGGADRHDLGRPLLALARAAIAERLRLGPGGEPRDPALNRLAATFVTLHDEGELRGCIGSLEPVRTLAADVRENALAAAFRDPRFPALTVEEFPTISIEVSVLSDAELLEAVDEAGLVALLRPGIDGVILEVDGRRATFLPQVWQTFADPAAFIAALKRKAGCTDTRWSPRMKFSRYTVTQWAERDFGTNQGAR